MRKASYVQRAATCVSYVTLHSVVGTFDFIQTVSAKRCDTGQLRWTAAMPSWLIRGTARVSSAMASTIRTMRKRCDQVTNNVETIGSIVGRRPRDCGSARERASPRPTDAAQISSRERLPRLHSGLVYRAAGGGLTARMEAQTQGRVSWC